jgi:hypothetical protein
VAGAEATPGSERTAAWPVAGADTGAADETDEGAEEAGVASGATTDGAAESALEVAPAVAGAGTEPEEAAGPAVDERGEEAVDWAAEAERALELPRGRDRGVKDLR